MCKSRVRMRTVYVNVILKFTNLTDTYTYHGTYLNALLKFDVVSSLNTIQHSLIINELFFTGVYRESMLVEWL